VTRGRVAIADASAVRRPLGADQPPGLRKAYHVLSVANLPM